MYSILSFDIISVVVPEPKNFVSIPISAVDAGVANRNGIKTLLANDGITFFNNGDPVLDNGPRRLPRNPTVCTILYN